MITPENIVFNAVAKKLRSDYGCFVSSETVTSPAKWPAVTIVEIGNVVNQKMRTLAPSLENATNVTYEVQVYSNKPGYKKTEAKKIMAATDEMFADMGFTRIMCTPVSNLADATIYRIVARYEGTVDKTYRVYTH